MTLKTSLLAAMMAFAVTPALAQPFNYPATVPNLAVQPQSATYTVGPTGTFYTVTAAMAALNNEVLVNGGFVNLQIQDGTISEPAALSWFNLFNRQIQISSQHKYSFTASSIQSSSGSAGAWTYVVNLNSVTNIAVGDYLTIYGLSGGTNPSYIAGVWTVTAVDGVNNRVTFITTGQQSAAASGAVSGTVIDVKGTLKFTNTDGFDIWDGASVANLTDLNIVGDGTAHRGIDLEDVGRLNANGVISVSGFGSNNILANYNSELNVNAGGALVASGSGGAGVFAISGAVIDVNGYLVSSGNTGQGIANFGGGVSSSNMVASGNGSDGILTSQNGLVSTSSGTVVTGNSGRGLNSGSNGVFSLSSVTSANNTTSDLTSYNVASLTIGGTSSTYPALVPAGANGQLNVRYGDLSGNAPILVRSLNMSVAVSSAATLSSVCDIGGAGSYVFSGTTSTWTLTTVANGVQGPCYLKNRGSGTVTINSNAGGTDIYSSSAVNTYALTAGSSIVLWDDGTYFTVR